LGSRLVQLVSLGPSSRCGTVLRARSWAILFSFTVPLMIKVWVVKTAFLFVGLGIP